MDVTKQECLRIGMWKNVGHQKQKKQSAGISAVLRGSFYKVKISQRKGRNDFFFLQSELLTENSHR